MKVEAYQCDYCNSIAHVDYMTGVINKPDLFRKDDFISVDADRADCHFCMECYRVNVMIPVQNKMNWREGEKYDAEREKLKHQLTNDFAAIFKKECYRRLGVKLGLRKPKK